MHFNYLMFAGIKFENIAVWMNSNNLKGVFSTKSIKVAMFQAITNEWQKVITWNIQTNEKNEPLPNTNSKYSRLKCQNTNKSRSVEHKTTNTKLNYVFKTRHRVIKIVFLTQKVSLHFSSTFKSFLCMPLSLISALPYYVADGSQSYLIITKYPITRRDREREKHNLCACTA